MQPLPVAEPEAAAQLIAAGRARADPNTAYNLLFPKLRADPIPPETLLGETPQAPNTLRFVCVSDTHLHGRNPHGRKAPNVLDEPLPAGDVLVHAGDFTMLGRVAEVQAFDAWLAAQPFKHKLVIAGNHDLTFEPETYAETAAAHNGRLRAGDVEEVSQAARSALRSATYLEDSGVDIQGVRVYGSPWQPEFYDWAFNLPRGPALAEKWSRIPTGVDVLLTHGPPLGHGDLCSSGHRAGCLDLLEAIQRVRPRYHVFGHIHEGYGGTTDGTTAFLNASTSNLQYKQRNPPLVFDVPIPAQTAEAVVDQRPSQ